MIFGGAFASSCFLARGFLSKFLEEAVERADVHPQGAVGTPEGAQGGFVDRTVGGGHAGQKPAQFRPLFQIKDRQQAFAQAFQ